MSLVPAGLTKVIAQSTLTAERNAPAILFGAGVVSMVGSTVLACRGTLKAQRILEQAQHDFDIIERASESPDYSDSDLKREKMIVVARTAGRLVVQYAPAIALGGLGLVFLTKSHHILKERNAALAAAYTAIDTAFKKYRERVVEKYGADEDRYFRHGAEEVRVVNDETGKTETRVRVPADGEPSGYARFFDQTSRCWSKDPEVNIWFLRTRQDFCTDLLRTRGHLFLNEVYEELGIDHTKAGAVVGWILDGEGDDYVDFGLYDGRDQKVRDFVNGRENAILLDFNVNGLIYNKIKDTQLERIRWQS